LKLAIPPRRTKKPSMNGICGELPVRVVFARVIQPVAFAQQTLRDVQ